MPEALSLVHAEDISIKPKAITRITDRIDFVLLIFVSFSFSQVRIILAYEILPKATIDRKAYFENHKGVKIYKKGKLVYEVEGHHYEGL